MALKHTIKRTVQGFSGEALLQGAYLQVYKVSATKHTAKIHLHIKPDANTSPVDVQLIDFTPRMDGVNFIAQAYEHLKTLPEFAGATDC